MKRVFAAFMPAILSAAMLGGCASQRTPDLYGMPAPPTAAERTIVITPSTRYVNVEGGQTVRFVAGDKEFAWDFFVGAGISSFPLNDVAPPGVLNHTVIAYVSPDPRYVGGDGRDK